MSSDLVSRTSVESPNELVIVRRRTGQRSEEHHGGIWKIAYADFMTAMMAFFLVMWLLNATDKQTIAAVANYFNPVKLTDRASNPKGVFDVQDEVHRSEDAPAELRRNGKSSDGDPRINVDRRQIYQEEALFVEPFLVLDNLAELATSEARKRRRAKNESSKGRAFRDPFDPEFRFLVAHANASELTAQAPKVATSDSGGELGQDLDSEKGGAQVDLAASDASGAEAKNDSLSTDAQSGEKPVTEPVVESVAKDIEAALRQVVPDRTPNVEVTSTSDGILISLTDEFDFGMFAIASAEPRPELVLIMERIANVLRSYPGPLVVRGHTDGRPFRTSTYDNWRLSSARAHMAYFMLVRGGVDEHRFERIEGHADRSLKIKDEPDAAQNRRIEILLRKGEAT